MLAARSIAPTDLGWHEGLTDWQALNTFLQIPAQPPVPVPSQAKAPPKEVQTNVKQGAVIGGGVCFALGVLLMFTTMWSFFIYGPLFFVAFILGIVAMAQHRVFGGLVLLLATLIVPAVLGLYLSATRSAKFAEKMVANSHAVTPQQKAPENIAEAMAKGVGKAERESDLKALAELRTRKLEFEKKLLASKNFRILRADFSKKKDSIGMQKPVIELTIQNDTGQPVKKAYFRGVLSSVGRAIPWIDEKFSYEIAGGLEPHEKAIWHLAPNMFDTWGKVNVPTDAQFEVTVMRLDGPDGKELFGDAHFGERDEKRLSDLERKHKGDTNP